MVKTVDYRALYYKLAAAMADAADNMDAQNFGQARTVLIRALQDAEEAVISEEEAPPITLLRKK